MMHTLEQLAICAVTGYVSYQDWFKTVLKPYRAYLLSCVAY